MFFDSIHQSPGRGRETGTGDGRRRTGDGGQETGDREAMTKQRPVYKFQQLEAYQMALEYVDHID